MNVDLIAITGGSGSGKTWLAQRLVGQFGAQANWLSLDYFYRDLAEFTLAQRRRVNFDHPNAIDWPLFRRTLMAIHRGEGVDVPQYDFKTHTRSPLTTRWTPCRLVIVDGLWLLRRVELRRIYSLAVFVDCPECLRRERRLARDQRERGRSEQSVRRQLEQQVLPMHRCFVASQARHADLVVDAEQALAGLRVIVRHCQELLEQNKSRPPLIRP